VLEPTVAIKSATKAGYEIATINDSINFTHPKSETRRGRVGVGVAQTLDCACNQAVIEPQIGAIRGRNPDNPKSRKSGLQTQQMLEVNENGTSNCLTSVQKDNVVIERADQFRIRRLTPRECFRLDGVRDEDINLVNSDTQSYKIAGNAIEVNSISSIIRQIYKPVKRLDTLF
jgi:DNA (cytosine-5)-methyltransferase 1